MSKVTLKDIAELANVSHMTVSRVLNGRAKNVYISSSTENRVRSAAKQLGYRPNAIAQAMRKGKTGIIALVYEQERFGKCSGDSYYLQLQGALERALSKNGQGLLICSISSEQIKEGKVPGLIASGMVESVILNEIESAKVVDALIDIQLPPIIVNSRLEKVGSVNTDCSTNFAWFIKKMYELGHRKYVLLNAQEKLFQLDDRAEIFVHTMHKLKIKQSDYHIINVDSWSMNSAGKLALDYYRKHDATAFCAVTEGIAYAAIDAFRDVGVNVPSDVSVVGCGGILPAENLKNQLSTVSVKIDLFAEMILSQLTSDDPKHLLVPTVITYGTTVSECKVNQ